MAQPSLQRPKSKIRLRLGLTPPHPKPLRSSDINTAAATSAAAAPIAFPIPAPAPSPLRNSSLVVSAAALSLNDSTSSYASGVSRPDSRSLFAYDSTSPSSHEHTAQTATRANTAFDTISYTSNSPSSVAPTPAAAQYAYPTPSSSEAGDTEVEVDVRVDIGLHHSPSRHVRPHAHLQHQPGARPHSRTDSLSQSHFDPHLLAAYQAQLAHDLASSDPHVQLAARTYLAGAEPEPRASLARYPYIKAAVQATDDVFWLADYQLSDRFRFVKELGFGNWGSVWLAKPMHPRASHRFLDSPMSKSARAVGRLGRAAATGGGSGAGGKVAVKLVHRTAEAETPYRVKALWEEMKIIRSLRQEPHPSIIQFEAFCISPSFAAVIMPYLSHLLEYPLSPTHAIPYLRQLASAIGYLHERGITHNDIKPANIMISFSDIPVLIDFGFAHKWDIGTRGAFMSSVAWGTPEYLEPLRARALPHDERTSDIWSLGITFFEILVGHTPFEMSADEVFETPEDQEVYYQRTVDGEWCGEWYMPDDLQHLIRFMLHPNPAMRISAMQAYHHPSLQPTPPSVMVTPHFIRAATCLDGEGNDDAEPETVPPIPATVVPSQSTAPAPATVAGGEKKKAKKKKHQPKDSIARPASRGATPALGESIKQHTSTAAGIAAAKKMGAGAGVDEADAGKKGSKLVLRKMRSNEVVGGDVGNEDPTPTKVLKPAQELPVKDASGKEKKIALRPSQPHLRAAAAAASSVNRPASTNSLRATAPSGGINSARSSVQSKENIQPGKTLHHRASALSLLSGSTAASAPSANAGNKEEAQLRAMQSLEGLNKPGSIATISSVREGQGKKRVDVLGAISRPAPQPPQASTRPMSEPVAAAAAGEAAAKRREVELQRRSVGLERVLDGVPEEAAGKQASVGDVEDQQIAHKAPTASPARPTSLAYAASPNRIVSSPPKKRLAKPALGPDGVEGGLGIHGGGSPPRLAFPSAVGDAGSPLGDLREKILKAHGEYLCALLAGNTLTLADDEVSRFRQMSGDLIPAQFTPSTSITLKPADDVDVTITATASAVPHSTATSSNAAVDIERAKSPALTHRKSAEALALDSRLDKISEWVKNVELIVEGARKALAEGRELPASLLTLPTGGMGIPVDLAGIALAPLPEVTAPGTVMGKGGEGDDLVSDEVITFGGGEAAERAHGLPVHLRTSSTQVEPATPPKWMTYAEAEERVLQANSWAEARGDDGPSGAKRASKKERPSVANVLKMFSAEKDKEEKEKTKTVRSSTPEPNMHVPLKPPAAPTLRATPSTPMLRSSIPLASAAATTRLPARRSESNLNRAFNTLPTHVTFADLVQQSAFSDDEDDDEDENDRSRARSPRRLYERFLDSTPGVVRQGEGWSSLSSGKGLAKPSSMASLRERARVLLGGGGEKEREKEKEKRDSQAKLSELTAKHATVPDKGANNGVGGRKIVDLAALSAATANGTTAANGSSSSAGNEQNGGTAGRRSSRQMLPADRPRPGTPGAASVLTTGTAGTASGAGAGGKAWGLWKGLKGFGKKDK